MPGSVGTTMVMHMLCALEELFECLSQDLWDRETEDRQKLLCFPSLPLQFALPWFWECPWVCIAHKAQAGSWVNDWKRKKITFKASSSIFIFYFLSLSRFNHFSFHCNHLMNNSCSYVPAILCKSNWWVKFKTLPVSAGHWIWGLYLCSFPESRVLGFPVPLQKMLSSSLLLLQRFRPVWVRLEQKVDEGLANPIHKYILPLCISGTRPFSKIKLLKPQTSFSFFLLG